MVSVPGLSMGQYQGLDAWFVRTPFSTAVISVFGGQLLSFIPEGERDLLWLSPTRQPLPTPIRGGTPVCWPYFARQGQPASAPAHGSVRTQPWRLVEASAQDAGSVCVLLEPETPASGPLRLRMELVVGAALEQRLITENTGDSAWPLTQALHNYFNVSDVDNVRIEGVDGLHYLDNYQGNAPFPQHGPWQLQDQRDPGRSDRIYIDAGGRYRIHDPQWKRSIVLQTGGSRSVVVWNPGQAIAAGMADVGLAWRGYVCVEAANAGPDVITLLPGQAHVLQQRMAVDAG